MQRTQSFFAGVNGTAVPEAIVSEILAELAQDQENETPSLAAAV
jgi:hypothetical protein